ncbi:MAG: hypothetical protein IPJ41_00920 [Phycisphaerales bacterium]|nr:hypothetical protein [Phycisphaerales bacterium]
MARKLPLAIGIVLLQAASLARAQNADNPDDATRPQPQAALAGPAVDGSDPESLVAYEYGGGLHELDLPPAEAALELLQLDPDTSDRVAQVLTERAMLAEQLIIDNFDLVSQGDAIKASGNKIEQGVFFLSVIRVLNPLLERGPLEDEIRPLLPADQAAEFDRLLDAYWKAVGRSRADQARSRGEKLSVRKAVREARRDQIGKEIELAAKRAIESERFAVEFLTKGLELTEAQHSRIERLVNDFVARTMGEAGQSDKERLFAEVFAYLNEHQQQLLMERIKGL